MTEGDGGDEEIEGTDGEAAVAAALAEKATFPPEIVRRGERVEQCEMPVYKGTLGQGRRPQNFKRNRLADTRERRSDLAANLREDSGGRPLSEVVDP